MTNLHTLTTEKDKHLFATLQFPTYLSYFAICLYLLKLIQNANLYLSRFEGICGSFR